MSATLKTRLAAKNTIQELLQRLLRRPTPSVELLDIIDVLTEINQKIDTTNEPAIMVTHLVTYIRCTASGGQVVFTNDEARLITQLSEFGHLASQMDQNDTDSADKAQFYGCFEAIPKH